MTETSRCGLATTELIWDTRRRGTAATSADSRLVVGEDATWSAEELLTTAVGTCFMRTLLRLAADRGIELLGYVSNTHLDVPAEPAASPELQLCACIVVASREDARQVAELCRIAGRESTVGRALRKPIVVVPQITVIGQVPGAVHAGV